MPWSLPLPHGVQPQGPPLSPEEMDLLVARAGLSLNPGQMADLVLAWRQLAGLIATIPHSTALADDQAYVFRLPAPKGAEAAAPPAAEPPAANPATGKPAAGAPRKAAARKTTAQAAAAPPGKPASRAKSAKPARHR